MVQIGLNKWFCSTSKELKDFRSMIRHLQQGLQILVAHPF